MGRNEASEARKGNPEHTPGKAFLMSPNESRISSSDNN